MTDLILWILIYAAGVISGAVFPPLTAWGIKQWRQAKVKRAEMEAKWNRPE